MLFRVSWVGALVALGLTRASASGEPMALKPVHIAQYDVPPGAYPIESEGTAPEVISQRAPLYPPELRAAGYDGFAAIAFEILDSGKVRHAVCTSSNDKRFAEAAVAALTSWRYKPGTVNGNSVDTYERTIIYFSISRASGEPAEAPVVLHGPMKKEVPPLPSGAYESDKVTTAPILLNDMTLKVPEAALAHTVQGFATVNIVVGSDGAVQSADVIYASDILFVQPALDSVKRWRFKPATLHGKAVVCRASERVSFPTNAYRMIERIKAAKLPPLDEPPVLIGKLTQKPVPTLQNPPAYPESLRTAGVEGNAVVKFVVKKDGTVAETEVIRSTDDRFADAAAEAIDSWRFRPGAIEGKTVNTLIIVPMNFSLREGRPPEASPVPHATITSLLPPLPEGVFSLSTVDVKPVAIHQEPPVYPVALRKAGISGRADIRFVVAADGSVHDVSVIKATLPEFGDAAAAVVGRWRFRPARIADKPVACRFEVPVIFSIHID